MSVSELDGNGLDVLRAYDPEAATEIEQDASAGIDVTDALYEALCAHDEVTAEQYLRGCLIEARASDPEMRGRTPRVDPLLNNDLTEDEYAVLEERLGEGWTT